MIINDEDQFDTHAYAASVLVYVGVAHNPSQKLSLQREQNWKQWHAEKWKDVCCQTVKDLLLWDVAVTTDQRVVDFVRCFQAQTSPTLSATQRALIQHWDSQGIETRLCPRPPVILTTEQLATSMEQPRSLPAQERKKFTNFFKKHKH